MSFCRKECLEHTLHVIGINTGSRIFERNEQIVGLAGPARDRQYPVPIGDRFHGLDGIHDLVKERQLKPCSVNHQLWKAGEHLVFYQDLTALQFAVEEL